MFLRGLQNAPEKLVLQIHMDLKHFRYQHSHLLISFSKKLFEVNLHFPFEKMKFQEWGLNLALTKPEILKEE